MKRTLLASALLMALGGAIHAEPLLGTWATEPDRKGQTGHVTFRTCGAALCGKIVSAFDASGEQVMTDNVGRELIWDLRNNGDGTYGGGRVYVPLMNKDFPVTIAVSGSSLELRACNAMNICRTQNWARVE